MRDGYVYAKCVHCGKTEKEEFTPSQFDMMQECYDCGNPVCQDCSDNSSSDMSHAVTRCDKYPCPKEDGPGIARRSE